MMMLGIKGYLFMVGGVYEMKEKKIEEYLEKLSQTCSEMEQQIMELYEKDKEYTRLINSLYDEDNVGNLFQVSKKEKEYQSNLQQKYEEEQKLCKEEIHSLNDKKKEYEKEIFFVSQLKNYLKAKEYMENAYQEQEKCLLKDYLYSVNQISLFLLQDSQRSNIMLNKIGNDMETHLMKLNEWHEKKNKINKVTKYSEYISFLDELNQSITENNFPLMLELSNSNKELHQHQFSNIGLYFITDILSVVYFFPDVMDGRGSIVIDGNKISVDSNWKIDSDFFWIIDAIMKYYCTNDCELVIK